MRKLFLGLGIVASLVFLACGLSWAQEKAGEQDSQEAAVEEVPPEIQVEPEEQWVLGSVVSVDLNKGELVIKRLDQQVGQEKEVSVVADDKTAYNNIRNLTELKAKDVVSIDYIVVPGGKNIARNISVEGSDTIGTQPDDMVVPGEGPATASEKDLAAQ